MRALGVALAAALAALIAAGSALRAEDARDPWRSVRGERLRLVAIHGEPAERHTSDVTAAAFSPDGKKVVTAGRDAETLVWDLATRHILRRLGASREPRTCVAISPDGMRVLVGEGKAACLYDLASGAAVTSLGACEYPVSAVAFSPDGKRVAVANATTVKVLEAASGAVATTWSNPREGYMHLVSSLDFDAKGERLAVGTDGACLVVALATGDAVAELTVPALSLGARLQRAVFAGEKRILASVGNELVTFDIESRKAVSSRAGLARGYSQDRKRALVLAGDGFSSASRTALVALDSGDELGTTPRGETLGVALAPDGRTVLLAGDSGVLETWSGETGAAPVALGDKDTGVSALAFSPGGERLLAGTLGGAVSAIDGADAKPRRLGAHARAVRSFAFSEDGARFLSTSEDRSVRVWDAKSGETTATLRGHWGATFAARFLDAKHVRSIASDSALKTWDLDAPGFETETLWVQASYLPDGFAPDLARAFVSLSGGRIALRDLASEKDLATFEGFQVNLNAVAFTPDARHALVLSDHAVTFLDLEKGTTRARIELGHSEDGVLAALSPDGRRAVVETMERALLVVDAEKGILERLDFTPSGDVALSLAFSPDGKAVAAGTLRGVVLRFACP